MTVQSAGKLTAPRAAALYIGALLGPGLLLLPGLAAKIAGPASIVAWLAMLVLSGLLARIFTVLGTTVTTAGGVVDYTAIGLGGRAGRVAGWCFLAGAVVGAPVVSLIGAGYVATLLGGGRHTSVLAAAILLLLVIGLSFGDAHTATGVQLLLVGALVLLVAIAVVGSISAAHTSNWSPFAPHGWSAIGAASSTLMLSFIGWEAIAPLTAQLTKPRRTLPRVTLAAFIITALVCLALAAATIAVLGTQAGTPVPLAALLRIALGPPGAIIATTVAVALTLAATNAYISGAKALAAEPSLNLPVGKGGLQLAIVLGGALLIGGSAIGIPIADLVNVPTALFLTVYLCCTLAASRILTGATRGASIIATAAVLVVLLFCGWALLVVLAIAIPPACQRNRTKRRHTEPSGRSNRRPSKQLFRRALAHQQRKG